MSKELVREGEPTGVTVTSRTTGCRRGECRKGEPEEAVFAGERETCLMLGSLLSLLFTILLPGESFFVTTYDWSEDGSVAVPCFWP